MKLFTDEPNEPKNVLPYEGEAIYYGPIFSDGHSDEYLDYLLKNIPWKQDELIMFGKHIVTERKIAWYGDRERDYSYSGTKKVAMEWIPVLLEIKREVEKHSGVVYNSCLLNLYEHGEQGLGWHSDDEEELGRETNIASLTFGAERRFDFRNKDTKEKVSIVLGHGSLLVMKGATQMHWQHQVPKTKKIGTPRINLTFRRVGHK